MMEEKPKRPGYLTDYARHAGISKQAAAVQLQRVGVDYLQPFDFDEADRLRAAFRHAARMPFSAEILLEDDPPAGAAAGSTPDDVQTKASPALAAVQIRKEEFRTKLLELEYRKQLGELVEKKAVQEEADRVARTVRDAVLNVAARVSGPVAAETDHRRVEDMLNKELRQALEALTDNAVTLVAITPEQLAWYNRGIVMLMALMNGRAELAGAERQVYERWRMEGALVGAGDE